MSRTDPATAVAETVSRRHPHRQTSVRMMRVLALAAAAALLTAGCGGSERDAPEQATRRPAEVREPPPAAAPRSGTPTPTSSSPTIGTVPATIGDVATVEAHPVRLGVASIGIEVEVVPVGVGDAGDMEVPSPEVAGWYRFGPTPGEEGTSVLAAHVDYDGRPGAFFRLRELGVGDRVEVSMSDGSMVGLSVIELTKVDKDDLAAVGVFERRGSPRVALITCGGAFDRSRRSYEDNVVAIAEPAG